MYKLLDQVHGAMSPKKNGAHQFCSDVFVQPVRQSRTATLRKYNIHRWHMPLMIGSKKVVKIL